MFLICAVLCCAVQILAMDVYRQLGSFARGLALFGELDVKQIQVKRNVPIFVPSPPMRGQKVCPYWLVHVSGFQGQNVLFTLAGFLETPIGVLDGV